MYGVAAKSTLSPDMASSAPVPNGDSPPPVASRIKISQEGVLSQR